MLKPLGPDVWHLPASEPVRLPGGLRLPLASTVVRLTDRSLLLYSPIALDDAAVAALAAEGEVAHIVAPSLLHHLHAKAAMERFPRATLHVTTGLAVKNPTLASGREIGDTGAGAGWGEVIEAQLIAGAPKLAETVLFHRPSGTVMCADLVFNVTAHANLMTRMILGMTGTGGKQVAQSRMWSYGVRDRPAARASLDRVLAWPIQRMSPCHGEPAAIDSPTLASKLARAYGRDKS
jgi:hypothetical protein